MDQAEFTRIFCQRPQQFFWFLGAGTSRSAGLPTATDIMWDLKRQYYRSEQQQDISRRDLQNVAVKERIQTYLDSKGFPALWSDEEYSVLFEKIFGNDKERQRQYIARELSEDKVSLTVGNRVLGGLITAKYTRAIFTTNFDSVVEKSVAEIGGKSLSAYALEGAHNANKALQNEEYPVYCKLHGDFRYDSIKNLSDDLRNQNEDLSLAFKNASNRFGAVVAGYSGRDASIMELFEKALSIPDAFPHGLFWLGMKSSKPLPSVTRLINLAKEKDISAHYVQIETFDALMLRLWRNLDDKPSDLESKVRRSAREVVSIPLPSAGKGLPIIRMNSLPVTKLPESCWELDLTTPKSWTEMKAIQKSNYNKFIFTKSDQILCWGKQVDLQEIFGKDLRAIKNKVFSNELASLENLQIKGMLEEALLHALARDKPILSRKTRNAAWLIANNHPSHKDSFSKLSKAADGYSGIVPGLYSTPHEDGEKPEPVRWSEALRMSLDIKDGRAWLLLDPDVWIWPIQQRRDAVQFLKQRKSNRYNQKYNNLLSAWVEIIIRNTTENLFSVSPFSEGNPTDNPIFEIGTQTGYSKRWVA